MNLLNKLPMKLKLLLLALPILGGCGYFTLIFAADSFEVPSVASYGTTIITSIIGAVIVVVLLFAILSIVMENIKKTPTLQPVYLTRENVSNYHKQ